MTETLNRQEPPFNREEYILQNHVNPDGLPVYPVFLAILEEMKRKIERNRERENVIKSNKGKKKKVEVTPLEPVQLVCVIAGGPGQGKTTTLEGVCQTIYRVLGIYPKKIKFDQIRAEFLEKTGKKKLGDLTKAERKEFKRDIIKKMVVKPVGGPVPHIVCIEGVFFGDTEPGDSEEIERGQSALKMMIQDPTISSSLAIFNVFGTDEVMQRAMEERILTDCAKDDWQLIQLFRLIGIPFREPNEEDKGKTELLDERKAMAGVDMIISINDKFARLARKSFGKELTVLLTDEHRPSQLFNDAEMATTTEDVDSRVSLNALKHQINQNLTQEEPDKLRELREFYRWDLVGKVEPKREELPKLKVGKAELEMLMVRILYWYKILQSMRFNRVLPTMKRGIETESARVFFCINQFWRERNNN